MVYVYYIDSANKVLLHPDAIKLCPKLGLLKEVETIAIILAYDYYSPYSQFTESDRQKQASMHVFELGEPKGFWSEKKILAAIDEYKSLQYNADKELERTYSETLFELRQKVGPNLSTEDLKVITSNIKLLEKELKELKKELFQDAVAQGKIMGGAELSFLDKFKQNRDSYLSLNRNRVRA